MAILWAFQVTVIVTFFYSNKACIGIGQGVEVYCVASQRVVF